MNTPEKPEKAKRKIGDDREVALTIPLHMFDYLEELARAGCAYGTGAQSVANGILLVEVKRMMDSGYLERRWR